MRYWDLSGKVYSAKVALVIGFLFIVCWAVYFNSLHVPFYLDDVSSITNNAYFKNASFESLYETYGLRIVGYLTLWSNYTNFGLDVTPYHIINIFIHMINGGLVFTLVLQVMRASNVSLSQNQILAIAFIAALLFVIHPLQTQAVTYIVQRLASLVTLFYLLSLIGYLGFRLSHSGMLKLLMLMLCLVGGVLAIFTKQNAFTLPCVIVLAEVVLFRSLSLKLILSVIVISVLAILGLSFLFPDSVGELLSKVDSLSRESKNISRLDYFLVQLPIVWEYLIKVVWPWPLHLEYDYSLTSFPVWLKIVAGIAHATVLIVAVILRRSYPAISFGVLFYYLTHLIESAVIPITDLAFEHRTYLPNFGVFLVISYFVVSLGNKYFSSTKNRQKGFVISLSLVILVLSFITWQRNKQWADPNLFYANEIALAPDNVRAIHNYAEYKLNHGEIDEALALLNKMYEVSDGSIDGVMLNTHLAALINARRYDEAISLGNRLLKAPLNKSARAVINSNMGIIYTNQKRYKLARRYYDQAYKNTALPINSLIAYSYTLYMLDDLDKAASVCATVLRMVPTNSTALQINKMIKAKQAQKADTGNQ